MNVPKSIHKCLLGMGYRYVGHKEYWKFLPGKPVAQSVMFNDAERFNEKEDTYEQTFCLDLCIWVPRADIDSFTTVNQHHRLCSDGTMQKETNVSSVFYTQGFRENEDAQAVEVIKANLERCMAELLDYDYWLALIDFQAGISSALPAKYAHLQSNYTKSVLPKGYPHPVHLSPFSETYQQIQEIEKNDALMQQIKDFVHGKTDTIPAELKYAAFYYEYRHCKKIVRVEIDEFGASVTDKCYYLMLAERYDELRQFVEQFPFPEKGGFNPTYRRPTYRYMLACAEKRKILLTDETRLWAEKKKLVAPNSWESVPLSTFLDQNSTQNQETATMPENMYAIFFSKKTALQSFVQTRFGVELTTAQGEKVADAMDAAEAAEQTEFIVRSPKGRWFVLLGAIEQSFDDGEDKLTAQLAQASEKAEVLLIANEDTSGSLWFEYHKNGKLKRHWLCSDGEIESAGKALNDLDKQSFISKFDEENGTPDTDILVAMAEKITGLNWETLSGAGTVYNVK
ncbi:MAG: hypothetical protein IKG79_08780 [Neisseriaceae bacterium]|nr:hypothetical protein [Neisseriaceae bacterium]